MVSTAIRAHPRHVVLAALVAGLLLGPVGALATLAAAAVAAALACRAGMLAAAAVLAGALLADARLAALDAGVLAHMHGQRVETRAVVLEPVRERGAGLAVARARLLDGPGAGEQAVLRVRVPRGLSPAGGAVAPSGTVAPSGGIGPGGAAAARAASRSPAAPGAFLAAQVGDIVAVTGRVEPLGAFDAYQARRNAHAAIRVFRVSVTGERRGGAAGVLDGIRRRAEAGLATGLAAPEAALLRGMVLGEDERLSDETHDEFQRSGLAHIVAVSGQNVMLLAVLVLGACALAGVPLRARLLLAAAVIALYVPLAGGGPSIQRAGVMGLAGLVAALAGRPARRWYALLLAAAVTLALNPRAAGEVGWQLSFAAVAALLLGAPPLRKVFERRMPAAVAEAAAITVAATLGTAPLMALHFGQVSLASLPANLLAAPAIAPVMWLGVLAAAAGQVSATLAAPFAALTGPLLVYIQFVAQVSAGAPLSVVRLGAPPAVAAGLWAALVALVALGVRRASHRVPRRPRLVLAAASAVAAAGAAVGVVHARPAPPPAPDELVVSFLDIGQGDATLIQLGGTTVLVDTGPPDGPILERLQEARVRRLDALLLTHAETDHEGAAPQVIRAYRPRLVVDGGAGWPSPVQRTLARVATRVHAPAQGEALAIGGLRFSVLWPPPRAPDWRATGNPNDNALVTRLEANGISVLLTADAESGVLAPLAPAPVDVLKVSHHGSADPGLPALLARLHPRLAAIEVGRHNLYGHPTASTVAALRAAVPTVVRTDRDGTVRLHARGGRVWLERHAGE